MKTARAMAATILVVLASVAAAPSAQAWWRGGPGGYGPGWHGGGYGPGYGYGGGWRGGAYLGFAPAPLFLPPPVYVGPPAAYYAPPTYYAAPVYPPPVYAPPVYAPPVYATPAAAQGCYAGPYVCPLDTPTPVGGPCSCPVSKGRVFGQAN